MNTKWNAHGQLFFLLVVLSLLISSCAKATTTPENITQPPPTSVPVQPTTPPTSTTAPVQPTLPPPPTTAPTTASAEVKGDINVVTWAGYDGTDFTDPFNAKYPDATLIFTLITTEDEIFTKLQAGFPADVILPTSVKLYVDNNLVQPIDTSRIEAWNSIPDPLKNKGLINGKYYMVPFDWSYCSILVRTDKVKTMPTSWADLWNPEYKGHVAIYDGGDAAVVYTSLAFGYDPYNLTDEQFQAVKQKLIELKPNLLMYWSDPYAMQQSVTDGDLWVVGGAWVEAYIALKQAGIPVDYINPKEGRTAWVGGHMIPTNAKNVDGAYAYINSVTSPDVQKVLGTWGFGMGNFDTIPLLDPTIVKLMSLDDITMLDRTFVFKDVSVAELQKENNMWSEVKSAP
jgi:spermidine/putrescine-binding protein